MRNGDGEVGAQRSWMDRKWGWRDWGEGKMGGGIGSVGGMEMGVEVKWAALIPTSITSVHYC